jgi:glycosyltransferase involved in cell wall biosynthesis
VKIISHKNNLGIAATRNDCLNYAKGDYVLFVDSDDWLELTMVEELVNSTQNGKIDIVACDYFLEKKNGQRIICQENYGSGCCENMRKAVNYEIFTILWKLLIRRSLFSNISFTPDINIGEDYIVSIKLYYYAQTFYHLHEPLYHYSQINDVRYSNLKIQNIEDHIKAVQEIEFFLKNVHIYDDDIIRRLNLRKFNIKKYFLDINFLNYERWKTTFPESDRMWREIPYSRKEKVKFWLAENHLFFLLKLITC